MIKNHIIYNSYSPWLFDLKSAKGCYLWKQDGTKLIDFSSGWNVVNLGWNNPEIAEAVARQARENVYAPMWAADDMQNQYATELAAVMPSGLDAIGRATGGTEANEMALKMARAFTERSKIIGIKDSYHGQSFGDLAIGYRPEYVTAIAPLLPGFIQLDYPSPDRSEQSPEQSLDSFKQKLIELLSKNDVAAVVTEAGIITGWGSVSVAPKGFLAIVRELTETYGTMLILDEVGTGFSRTGKLFGMEHEAVTPDFVTLAKGISNGAGAIGAVITTREIADATFDKAHLTSTFGWTPLACAAAQKTLEIHKRDKIWEKVSADGDYVRATLRNELEGCNRVKNIRGLGLEIGIELTDSSGKAVVQNLLQNGLHLAETDESILQIMPPLTIERNILDEGLNLLISSLKSYEFKQ